MLGVFKPTAAGDKKKINYRFSAKSDFFFFPQVTFKATEILQV